MGYSAALAGAALIPQTDIFLAISPLSGALVSSVDPRWLMISGILIVAVSLVWLSGVHAGASYTVAILPVALLWGASVSARP